MIAFIEKNDSNCNQILFDLKEMICYRKHLVDYRLSQQVSSRFFKSKFPEEIAQQILAHAFNPEVEASLAIKLRDENDKNNEEKPNCLCM